jgi:outer membrane cobalamin receptor
LRFFVVAPIFDEGWGFFIHNTTKEEVPMKQQFKALLYFVPMALSYGMPSGAGDDSTRTYRADEVVVTATRSNIQPKDSPSPVQVITTEDIQRTNGSSVADILRSSESIFVKDQGPTASLKTVSFRGMASEHILVLLDGTRINNFQNGSVDFSLLPMGNIDRIEVVRGGNSSLYGADALGGIINIISSRPSEILQAHSDVSLGSFNYQRYSLDVRGRIQGVGIVFGMMHDQATGDYPFIFHRVGLTDTTRRRDGSDFTRTQLYLNTDYSFDNRSNMTFSIQRVKSNQGVPGSLTFISAMRQDDDAVTTVASLHDNHLNNLSFSLNLGFTYGLQMYYSQTKTTLATVNPQIQWVVTPWDRVIVGVEFVEGHLDGMLPATVSNEMLFQHESASLDRLSLFQSIRYDALSEGQESCSPKIGFNLRLVRDWDTRIRASYGKNFRMPTFNDLYSPWGGNPALKPEHSECFDVGMETTLDRSGVHSLQLTYFNIDTKDRILLTHIGWNYFPINVSHAQSIGLEGRYDLRLYSDAVSAFTDVTINNAFRQSNDSTNGKQLLYIPKAVCSFGISAKIFSFQCNISQSYTSERFTTEDESVSLPDYWLTDLNISTVVPLNSLRLNFRVEISNVFDTDYQVLPDYPMPERSFRITLGIDY